MPDKKSEDHSTSRTGTTQIFARLQTTLPPESAATLFKIAWLLLASKPVAAKTESITNSEVSDYLIYGGVAIGSLLLTLCLFKLCSVTKEEEEFEKDSGILSNSSADLIYREEVPNYAAIDIQQADKDEASNVLSSTSRGPK